MKIDKFFTSGWDFSGQEMYLKSRYQMVNIALVLSSFASIFGLILNYIKNINGLMGLEIGLIVVNIALFFLLRESKKYFEFIAFTITLQCTFLMLYIIYTTDLESMKYVWLFTYPVVLLYFQKRNIGIYWFGFVLLMLFIAPFQNFIEIKLSVFTIMYMSVALIVVSIIVYFYQVKMNEARDLILEQQEMLKGKNEELLNQLKELQEKDNLLSSQSKQAVMGEMISMIAHQWRQPLSTITLQISNYQFKQLLSENVQEREIDKTLAEISDTIIYLSDTVDDFQTYFNPNKEVSIVELHELLQRAVNFSLPRLKESGVEIVLERVGHIELNTHINELIQVLLNIINNAIDALVLCNTSRAKILINLKNRPESVFISVKDNAKGIKEENLPYLFEPYFSTKGKNGTGLGLYMSQMIMQKQFETQIEVQTGPDGSTFTIEIPKSIT